MTITNVSFFKGNENADTLIVGESVIDVMSIMSVYAKYNTDFTQFAYLALSGTNKLGSVFYNLRMNQVLNMLL